jgi:hypothetical protein
MLDFNENDSIGRIKLYEDGLLLEKDEVPAFRGGFVFLTGDQSAFVNLPPNSGFRSGRMARRSDVAELNPIDGMDWLLPMQASNGKFTNTLNALGMHPESIRGFDKHDEPLLPVPYEISGFELYFTHPGEKYEKLSRDIVKSTDFYTWDFEVKKYGGSGNITLQWDNAHFGNNQYNLILIDETNDRMTDMRASDTFTFSATAIHKFKIYYGTEERLSQEILPLRLQVGEIYPNPFEDEMNIPVSLPEINDQYQVEVSLSDLNGKMVEPLSSIQLNPGYHLIKCQMNETINYGAGFYVVRIIISSAQHKEILYRKVLKL